MSRILDRSLRVAVAGALLASGAPGADAAPAPSQIVPAPARYRSAALAGKDDPKAFLEAYARGYHPELSGAVVWVSKPHAFFTEASTNRNHGSAWGYDTRVPFVLYGPGQIRARDMKGAPAQSFDIPATFSALIGIDPPPANEGRAWTETFEKTRKPVKAVVAILLDQVSYHDMERYLDRMPTLARWRREGADFPEVRNAWLPSVTAMAHAGVGTGTLPGTCGIPGNFLMRPDKRGIYDAFKTPEGDIDLSLLQVRTFAEWLDEQYENRPVVISQVYAHYAALAMAGRGTARKGGDADVVVWYNKASGKLETDEAHFRFPEYLRGRGVDELIRKNRRGMAAQFRGRMPPGALATVFGRKAIRATPFFARWQASNLIEMITRERVGMDEVPDLVLANLKSTDATGHIFGHDHVAYPAALAEVDRLLGMLEKLLDQRAGPGNWAVALSADHGLPPDDCQRRVNEEFVAALNQKLDGAGDGDGKGPLVNARAYEFFVDEEELAADGKTLADVKRLVLEDPDVLYAWTRDEVMAARAKLQTTHP